MSDSPRPDISAFRRDRPWRVAVDAPDHPTLRLISIAFVIAGLCHLWLADAWQLEWLPGNLFFLVGLILLVWRPCALAFGLCAIGKFLPLLMARDHLTQSLLMALFAGGGAWLLGMRAYLATWPDRLTHFESEYGEISGHLWAFFDLLRLVTIATYALAAWHKLNRDFFDPQVSCAVYGAEKVGSYYGLSELSFLADHTLALAIAVIAVEASIALLYLLGRRRLALVVALAFHIPLTLTMAPAFAFVMLIGHAAFLRPTDLDEIRELLRRRWPLVVGGAAVATAASLVVGSLPFGDLTMIPRKWLLFALLLTGLTLRPWRGSGPPTASLNRVLRPRIVAWIVAALFLLHSLTPYLGIRFQLTGAMVSNLRIDEGCWNHLIVPESVRLEDRYIRIDEAYFVEPGALKKYEAITTEQLWNAPMVRQMRKNWCRDDLRPFYLAGTYRKQSFEIDDLCDDDLVWPFDSNGIIGSERLENHLLFQRNLPRHCPSDCIH